MSETNRSFPNIDRGDVQKHLRYLGYGEDDNVNLRFFYHSEDPRKKNDKGRKLSRLDLHEIERLQQEGRGVYVVVNGAAGGHQDKDIKGYVAIFCEWDKLSRQEQLSQWQKVGFFEPTFTVYSGNRSMQDYWIFDASLGDDEQWRRMQKLLIEVMQADRANKNPSRVFRLAGCFYIRPGCEPVQTKIVRESGKKYSPSQLLEKLEQIQRERNLPAKQPVLAEYIPSRSHQEFPKCEDITLPVPESVPLEACLSKTSRQLLESGVSHGERNDCGAKLARDLIGTANYLQGIGQPFDGEPYQLFLDYCHRCPTGEEWDEGEWDGIWDSAQKDNPTPSCTSTGVDNCIRGWYWNNYIKPNLPNQRDRNLLRESTNHREPNDIQLDSSRGHTSNPRDSASTRLRDRIVEILNGHLSPSERKQAFINLSKSTKHQLAEIEQLAALIESESELVEGRTDRIRELDALEKIRDRRLVISDYLHPTLAKPLERLALWMGVDVEAMLTVLLPTAASLLHPQTRIVVKECIDFVEPMIFYAGIVSESGNRKTPIFQIITKHLRKLQYEEDARYQKAQEQSQEAFREWKRDKSANKAEPPEIPKPPREYLVDNITGEALDRIKAQQPQHGILICKDELSGLFSSYGAYKGGKGSDKEGILSGWSGGGVKVNRASGSRLSIAHDASSIVGAIQPGKLRKLMGDFEDEQGEWARFLWYVAPLKAFKLPEHDTRFDVGDLLEGIYRRLDCLPPVRYRFDREAQKCYEQYHWELEQKKQKEPRQGVRSAIAKMQGYVARIAGILHLLWEIAAGREPEKQIPLARMEAAKKLGNFYLEQVQSIYSDEEAARGELSPILSYLWEKARQLGEINARTAQQYIKPLKKTPAHKVREYFNELAAMGYGTVEGQGNRIKFIPLSVDRGQKAETIEKSIVDSTASSTCRPNVDPSVDQGKVATSIDRNALQRDASSNCRPVDPVDPFSEFNISGVQQAARCSPIEEGIRQEESSSLDNGQQSLQVYTSAETIENAPLGTVDLGSTRRSTVNQNVRGKMKIQVGDRCRYHGPPGAMAVTCRRKSLLVLETRLNGNVMQARVKADEWTVDYWILFSDLRREAG